MGILSRGDSNSWNLQKSSLQDGVVLDAWVQSHAIDTVAPQQVVKVQPTSLVLLLALLKLLLVIFVSLEVWETEQLTKSIDEVADEALSSTYRELLRVNRKSFHIRLLSYIQPNSSVSAPVCNQESEAVLRLRLRLLLRQRRSDDGPLWTHLMVALAETRRNFAFHSATLIALAAGSSAHGRLSLF